MFILLVIAVVVIGLPYLWRVKVQGWASAIRKGGFHPLRQHSRRKRQGVEAAVAMQSAPPPCTVYAAGWCEQDPGPGGWAYVRATARRAKRAVSTRT
jgi:hypothetical protein